MNICLIYETNLSIEQIESILGLFKKFKPDVVYHLGNDIDYCYLEAFISKRNFASMIIKQECLNDLDQNNLVVLLCVSSVRNSKKSRDFWLSKFNVKTFLTIDHQGNIL